MSDAPTATQSKKTIGTCLPASRYRDLIVEMWSERARSGSAMLLAYDLRAWTQVARQGRHGQRETIQGGIASQFAPVSSTDESHAGRNAYVARAR
jgi:hypothetical protein